MELTVYEDNLADDGSIIIDRYIDYFMNNLQDKIEIDGTTYLESADAANDFLSKLTTQLFTTPDFERWVKDDTLDKLHREIKANGMKLCPLNFYTLCQYILTIIKEQYFVLLKPTIADTIAELSDVKSITFTNGDGKEVKADNAQLIQMVMDNLKVVDNPTYEADKIIRVDKLGCLMDKALLQSSFIYYVALFLSAYFKDYPRRSNCCMVSATEQKLILYMLYFFGLAPAPLTDSRFRQLIGYYKEHQTRVSYSILPEVGVVSLEIIKYGDWKDGIRLDKLKDPINLGDTVTFPQNLKIEIQHITVSIKWLT